MRHKYDFSPFFSFCHNNVIFLCNKVGLFVAFSCSTGLWYRTLILSFLIWVLFFALNDCFWKWLKNECANPGEARQTWRGAVRTLVRRDKPEEARYKPWRRLPSPPGWGARQNLWEDEEVGGGGGSCVAGPGGGVLRSVAIPPLACGCSKVPYNPCVIFCDFVWFLVRFDECQ